MILTQRQLEQLLKLHGKIVIPYRARLTPSAQDWLRHNKVSVGYDEVKVDFTPKAVSVSPSVAITGRYLWWSDGPDGIAKAAIGMSGREVMLESMAILEDASRAISAVRTLSQSIASNAAHGGELVVRNAGIATVLANKAPNLRAVVATTMAAVEESIASIAANVLIVERDKWPLSPLKNLLVRFCKLERKIDPVVENELKMLGTADERGCTQIKTCCGGCKR